jgi:hypothetical protein
MNSQLTPLALLIPAVVLAQPALQAPAPPSQVAIPPQSTMPDPAAKPVNPTKAAAALSTAKELSSKLKGDSLSSRKLDCGSGYTTISVGGSGSHECIKT